MQKNIDTFNPRLFEGVWLGHQDGGVYHVLSMNGVCRTKHTHPFELEFPGMSLLEGDNGEAHTPEEHHDFVPDTTQILSDSTEGSQSQDSDLDESAQDILTHIPHQPSMNGESDADDSESIENAGDHEIDTQESGDNVTDSDFSDAINAPPPEGPYALRPRSNVKYSCMALPSDISTSDEPSISEALSSPERSRWISQIAEDFTTLEKAGTWVNMRMKPPAQRYFRQELS